MQNDILPLASLTFQLDWALLILYAIHMTVDEQIAELIRTGSGKMIDLARLGTVLLMAVLLLAGAFTGNPVFYGIAAFAALVTFAIWQTTPHMRNAARGLKEGFKQNGTVEISIKQWTDPDSHRHESCHGLIAMDNQPLWQMEFVTSHHWQPLERKYSAQLVFISGIEWPVAILTDDGLLYPRLKPRRACGFQK